MIELGKEQRQGIGNICMHSKEVLVRGAVEGTMGRVWVPELGLSPYCLIVVGDFAYLLGMPPRGARALDLKRQIYESAGHAYLYPQNERWGQWLEERLAGQLRTVTRYALKKDEYHFDMEKLKMYRDSIPQGIKMKHIDEKLYHLAMKEEWSKVLCENFEDFHHFKLHGFGYAAVKDRKIVSGCSAYGVSEGMMEIQVATRREYRRQGLALACSAAFLLECLQKDIIPNWDATNQQSVDLAEKLGYVYEREYQVYQLVEIDEPDLFGW